MNAPLVLLRVPSHILFPFIFASFHSWSFVDINPDLQKAYADYDAGNGTRDDLVAAQDKAAEDSLLSMAETGETLITDGEQRASSFANYPITDTLGGTGLATKLAADGQYFAMFDDEHHRQLPRLITGPMKYNTYAYETLKKSMAYAQGKAMKQAVISA